MNIRLEPLKREDARPLYVFEAENREFFETAVPSRGDDYYLDDVFLERLGNLLEEQAAGISRFYLIKDEGNRILGRVNLTDINTETGTGELGYRVAKMHVGKGVASLALSELLKLAGDIGVRRILAKTTTANIASCKVLEKNGFLHTGTDDLEFLMNNETMRFTHYEWSDK
ncbi:GNAT family N-acetyltransferase [Bhargavaea ginsengi]|uniref:GNAT family N-acetyltransferase n=1 Tax=Bhargavaea ginsengi TaxID=426757 RepID=UPI00203E1463|nr:GNAT family N-acetyltransferase [Bhargavaea ginsengi]MCM3087869.1 GNAT family N-acetyltransferase [Bhargavaea ginsengi]